MASAAAGGPDPASVASGGEASSSAHAGPELFEVLLAVPAGVTCSELTAVRAARPPSSGASYPTLQVVELGAQHNAVLLEPAAVEAEWARRVAANPRLFNKSKFRLARAAVVGDTVQLWVGFTDYKSYVGTNMSPDVASLIAAGREHGDEHMYLAHPLGVGAVVTSSDDQVLFIRRSQFVAEAPGMLDLPGGHPEPSNVWRDGIPDKLEDRDKAATIKELFGSILDEVHAEINIPYENLRSPILTGFIRNRTTAGRASATFVVPCDLTAEEIKRWYTEGGSEKEESTNLVCVPVSGLEAMMTTIAPAAHGCLTLWERYRKFRHTCD